MEHIDIPAGEIHAPHNWQYADATARSAAVITDATLVGKVARQADDNSYWTLTAVSPATWTAFKAATAAHTHEIAEVNGLTAALAGKATSTHTHIITDVAGLQAALDGKALKIAVKDETTSLTADLTTLKFTGAGITATLNGGEIVVDVPGGGSGGSGTALIVKEEGASVAGTTASINFTGPKITASAVGDDVTVNVAATTKADVGLSSVEDKSSATIRSELTSANVTAALTFTPANAASLTNVENKSSATIRSEITSGNVTTALGFTPANAANLTNVENKSSTTIRSEITSGNVTTALGFTPINPTEKGANNGVATLDGTGKLTASQIPGSMDDVVEYANLAAFPATGTSGLLYVALDTNKVYRWSGSAYVEISPSPGSTDSVTEGSTNKYFTESRVLATVLAGLSTATNAAVTAADTVLGAIGKLQKQVTDLVTKTSRTQVNKGNSGTGTIAFARTDGMFQKVTITGAGTLTLSGWEVTGDVSEMEIEIVNGGSAAFTWGTTVNWKQPDGTYTTNFSTYLTAIGRSGGLMVSGRDFAYLRTSDNGTYIVGEVA